MALPSREYFYLEEVMQQFSLSKRKIQYYIETGGLEVGAWLKCALVRECYIGENGYGGWSDIDAENAKPAFGIYSLLPEDCIKLFRQGDARLTYLKSFNSKKYFPIGYDTKFYINVSDIIITEASAIEFKNNYRSENSIIINHADLHTNFKYYNNFKEVIINDEMFKLGAKQAIVVKALYNAYLEGKQG